jgi:hypothetical protein
MIRTGFLLLMTLFCSLSLHAEELEIFQLKGSTPQEIIPLVKPFVGPDGTVTGRHDKLIVRTSSERMAQVRKILQQFDRAPRRLLLQLRDTAPSEAETNDIDLSLSTPHLRLGEGKDNGVRLKRYTTRTQEANLRSVQTIEGQPTLITSGVSRPVQTGGGYIVGPRASEWSSYGYQNLSSGLYATVRLVGERVRIEITTQKQTPLTGSPEVSQQATSNVVSGRLGAWLPLAGVSSQRRQESRGIASRADSEASQESELWVRVELLPD